jgi:hypothetical protein
VKTRVFCFLIAFNVHIHPEFLRVCADTLKERARKMPKLATPLTDTQPRKAKPRDKPYKLADGGGMHLLVNPDGSKYWRMGYRFAGTERLLQFRKYPQISLAGARKARSAACDQINAGIVPSQVKRLDYIPHAAAV